AAKLRSGGPILPIGMKAKGLVGNPPPRTVIGTPSQAYERGRNCRGTLSVLQSLCRTQNDAVRYNALPHEPTQSDQYLACQGSLRARGAFSVQARYHWAKALSFWYVRNRHANCTMPRRTRPFPERANPFSRRFLPLSSGEPVRPA